jgi:hypothetical protein
MILAHFSKKDIANDSIRRMIVALQSSPQPTSLSATMQEYLFMEEDIYDDTTATDTSQVNRTVSL